MIPKIAHLIWLNETVDDKVLKRIDRLKFLNPNHQVLLHRNSSLLNPIYRESWNFFEENYPQYYQFRADLLRYSVLEKYGGWYLDIDCFPLVPFEYIEKYYKIEDSQLFLTRREIFLNNDILAVSDKWDKWKFFHDYIPNRHLKEQVSYGIFAPRMFNVMMKEYSEHFLLGDDGRFHYAKKYVPFIVRDAEKPDGRIALIKNKLEVPLLLNRMGLCGEGVIIGGEQDYFEWVEKSWLGRVLDESEISNGFLDFIYISDTDIKTWLPKLKKGGLMAGKYDKNMLPVLTKEKDVRIAPDGTFYFKTHKRHVNKLIMFL